MYSKQKGLLYIVNIKVSRTQNLTSTHRMYMRLTTFFLSPLRSKFQHYTHPSCILYSVGYGVQFLCVKITHPIVK